jgi:hypothetical protein
VLRADSAAAIRYLVAVGETVPFRVDGPGSIRVRVRLSRVPRMTGPRAFTLTVYERGQELLRRELQVARSARVICADLPGAALSTERVVSVRPATGSGELSLCVSGTTAKSALVGVEYLPAEKYEE